jgi:hypothetical protein
MNPPDLIEPGAPLPKAVSSAPAHKVVSRHVDQLDSASERLAHDSENAPGVQDGHS